MQLRLEQRERVRSEYLCDEDSRVGLEDVRGDVERGEDELRLHGLVDGAHVPTVTSGAPSLTTRSTGWPAKCAMMASAVEREVMSPRSW